MHIDAVGVLDFKDYKIFFRKNHMNNPLPFLAKAPTIQKPHARFIQSRA